MKKYVVLIVLLHGSIFALAQWVINSNGDLANTSDAGIVKINNIKAPCVSCDTLANIDLFAIFNDGRHYNSRYCDSQQKRAPNPSPYFNSNCDKIPDQLDSMWDARPRNYRNIDNYKLSEGLNVKVKNSSGIRYFKIIKQKDTDDDDLPELEDEPGVSPVVPDGEIHHTMPQASVFNELLTASNDVVPDKDITLVIKKPPYNFQRCSLYAQRIRHVDDTSMADPIDNLNIFKPHSIFNHQFVFGANNPNEFIRQVGFAEAEMDVYTYINLIPNIGELNDYLPSDDDEAKYLVVFGLEFWRDSIVEAEIGSAIGFRDTTITTRRNDEGLSVISYIVEGVTLEEEIHHSHDPNYFKVKDIYRAVDNRFYIDYELSVQNTGTEEAKSVFIYKTFHPDLDINSQVQVDENIIGGKAVVGGKEPVSVRPQYWSVKPHQIKFDFPNAGLAHCVMHDGEDAQTKIVINYSLKCPEGFDEAMALTSRWFNEDHDDYFDNYTVFDGREYLIHRFEDISLGDTVIYNQSSKKSEVVQLGKTLGAMRKPPCDLDIWYCIKWCAFGLVLLLLIYWVLRRRSNNS